MRLVIDLQACQNGSADRGIGRYALAMTRALVRAGRGRHSFRLMLSDRFPERVARVRAAFDGLLEPHEIVVTAVPPDIGSATEGRMWRTRAAEVVWSEAATALKPDAWFTPSLFEGFWEDVVTSVEAVPWVTAATIHDLIPLEDPEAYLAGDGNKSAYARKIASVLRCDLLFAVSEHSKREAVARLGVDPARIDVAPLGAEPEFHPADVAPERRAALLRRHRIRGRFLITASPFEARKNLEGLIAGFAATPPSARGGVQLVICGRMDLHARDRIAAWAEREGLRRSDIVLPGFVPDEELIDLYRLCEAMVFPSLSEGFGLPPLEAMACGAAVLASSATSLPEVVGREDALFDPTSPGDIGRAITRVLTDETFRQSLRDHGPRHAATFSWDRSAARILERLEAACDARRSAPQPCASGPGADAGARRLAVVASCGTPGSRENAVVRDYIRRLSAARDLTLFSLDGELGSSVTVPLAARPAADFLERGGAFDRVLYILDSSRLGAALPLMAARPGVVLLYEPLAPGDPAAFQDARDPDPRTDGGWRPEPPAAGGAEPGPRGAAAAALAHGLAVEVDSPLAAEVGAFTVAPRVVGVDPSVQLAFRHARRLPDGAPLWTAFVADDDAADRLARLFRSRPADPGAAPCLLIVPARSRRREETLSGRIWLAPAGFTSLYLEVISASAALYVDPALPPMTRRRLQEDARALGAGLLDQALSPVDPEHPAGEAAEAAWPPAQDALFLDRIEHLLSQAPRPAVPGREAEAPLPVFAGDAGPTPRDLRDVARALVLNAERSRPGRILVDVTALVKTPATTLDGQRRQLLRALLAADERLTLVADDGADWFVAGGLTGALTGALDTRDEVFWAREADRLVSVDLFDGGLDPETTARSGVRAVDLRLNELMVSRPDLVAEIAAAAAEALREEVDGTATDRAAGPVRRVDVSGRVTVELTPAVGKALGRQPPAALALARALARPAPRLDPRLDLSLTVQGHVGGSYSLAMVNRRIAGVLDDVLPGRVGYAPIETGPVTDLSDVPDEERPLVERLVATPPAGARHVALCQHWPVLPPAGRADIGVALIAWEESHLPGDMVQILNGAFDGVLAQVRSVQKALIDSGVHVPTALTGLPMDIGPYEGVCRRDGPARRFLHVSSCFPRKGVDVLLEAWARAFTARDRVTLVIKTFPNPHNTVHAQVYELSTRYPEMAPIQIVNVDMDRDELIDLYRDADVMVLPTRGEGYNLPALEAMAAGLPLIVTGYGGQTDFCGPADARQLDYAFALSGSHVRDSVAYWVEPSVEDLVAALREQVAPDQQPVIEARRRRARLSARAAVDPGRWTRVVTEFAASLAGPVETGPVPTDWISTWGLRCGIAEYSRFLIDHMAAEWRTAVTVVADDRTETGPAGVAWRHGWGAGGHHAPQRLLSDIAARDPEAVILQHQDGLIEWVPLAALLESDVLSARTTLVELHVVRTLERLPEADLRRVVAALSRADRLLVHTIDDLNRLKGYGLIDNVALFPHGAIRPEAPPPPVRALGPASAPVIGCHGFLFHHKRVDALIRAAAELRGRWPGLRLRLVNASFGDEGSAAALQHAREVAAEVGMTDAIDWVTDFLPVEEIRARLAGCDLLVLPYDETGDSSSGAVRVAMSAQVPTLTTTAKIFDDVADAVSRVESNAPAELAAAMARLLESPEQRARVQGRIVRWLELHDWRRMAAQLEGIVKALAYARRREARGAGGL